MGFVKLLLICGGMGLVAGGVAAMVGALGGASEPLTYAAATLIAGGIGLWLSWRWWVAVDEAVREAHKTSWFWGGSTAMILVGAVALALFGITQGDASQQLGVTREEAGLLLSGIVFTLTLMLAGYGVCWAGWWFLRSR